MICFDFEYGMFLKIVIDKETSNATMDADKLLCWSDVWILIDTKDAQQDSFLPNTSKHLDV